VGGVLTAPSSDPTPPEGIPQVAASADGS